MPQNTTYHNPINQEEYTPLVTILEVRTDLKQATAVDSRKSPFNIDLSKAAFGATYYPLPGSQWYLKKISGVWTLMARAPRQNPQLDPALNPQPGDTFIGGEGSTFISPPITAVTATATDDAFRAEVVGDVVPRAAIRGDGMLIFSDGTNAADITLYRSAADQLKSDDEVRVIRPIGQANDWCFSAGKSGETIPRTVLNSTGQVWFSDGASSWDTNIYRSGAATLKTDGTFIATTGKFGGSGPSNAVYIGDDGIFCDVNVTDAIGVQGQANAANGKFVFGSAKDTNLYRSGVAQLKTDGELVASNSVWRARFVFNSSSNSVFFNSIPSGLRVIVVRWIARSDRAGGNHYSVLGLRINNDGGGNYNWDLFQNNNGTVQASANAAQNYYFMSYLVAADGAANVWSSGETQILGWDQHNGLANGLGITSTAQTWGSTDKLLNTSGGPYVGNGPYNQLVFFDQSGTNLIAGTDIQLYGYYS